MDIRRIEKPLAQFVGALPTLLKVDEVIVFGSYLHGNAAKDSDVDVLVISDDFKSMNEDQRLDMLYDAAEDIDPEIEPWGFTHSGLACVAVSFSAFWVILAILGALMHPLYSNYSILNCLSQPF